MQSWQHPSDRHPLSGRQRIHDFARDAQWKWVRFAFQAPTPASEILGLQAMPMNSKGIREHHLRRAGPQAR